eukprot:scaffold25077_cov116-Isochrysis_galbana.AAC.3
MAFVCVCAYARHICMCGVFEGAWLVLCASELHGAQRTLQHTLAQHRMNALLQLPHRNNPTALHPHRHGHWRRAPVRPPDPAPAGTRSSPLNPRSAAGLFPPNLQPARRFKTRASRRWPPLASEAVDARLDQNQPELSVLVLAELVQVLRNLGRQALLLEDAEDLGARDMAHLERGHKRRGVSALPGRLATTGEPHEPIPSQLPVHTPLRPGRLAAAAVPEPGSGRDASTREASTNAAIGGGAVRRPAPPSAILHRPSGRQKHASARSLNAADAGSGEACLCDAVRVAQDDANLRRCQAFLRKLAHVLNHLCTGRGEHVRQEAPAPVRRGSAGPA